MLVDFRVVYGHDDDHHGDDHHGYGHHDDHHHGDVYYGYELHGDDYHDDDHDYQHSEIVYYKPRRKKVYLPVYVRKKVKKKSKIKRLQISIGLHYIVLAVSTRPHSSGRTRPPDGANYSLGPAGLCPAEVRSFISIDQVAPATALLLLLLLILRSRFIVIRQVSLS